MTIVERAAYLKGLVEGLGLEPDSPDGKLWRAMTELLSDMAHEIEDLQTDSLDMADAMDEICEELSYLEDLSLDLDQPEDFADLDEEDDEDYSPALHLYEADEEPAEEEEIAAEDEAAAEEDEEIDYDGILYDVTCPSCGKEITFGEETLDQGSITCPDCGEVLEFDLGGDEDE